MRRWWRSVAFLPLILLGAAIPRGPALAAATGWVGDAHAAARLITAVEATGSGSRLDAGLQIRLAPGWHAYWRTPGDAGLPASIDWKGSKNLTSAVIAWPAPRRFSRDGLETQGYENGVVLPIAVTLAHSGAAVLLRADVRYAACKDICVPYQAKLELTVPPGLAVPGPQAPLIAAARAKVPGDRASARLGLVGAAVGFALARGPLDIALVFAALGLGMAAPFLAVADVPGVVAWLPRPGRWMEWLRRALGLALLGAAVWLLSVLATEAGLRSALAAGAALLALLILLAARGVLRFDRYGSTVLGAAAVVVAVVAVLAPSLYGRAAPIETASRAAQTGLWRRYDAAALQRLVGEGKVVLVDVSAAWCLTCKVNELTVLERAPVADKLHEPSVVAMRANWTRPDPTITAYLQSFGRYGVPLDAVYGPGVRGGIASPELLNSAAVMDAFQRAASSPAGHQEAKK